MIKLKTNKNKQELKKYKNFINQYIEWNWYFLIWFIFDIVSFLGIVSVFFYWSFF